MGARISRQWMFVLAWSALVVLIANIPYIFGYAVAPSDKLFMGDARSFIDTNTYIAWMHQAADGHFLFKDIYTTEPHDRMLFHPLFFLLGNVSRLTGLSPLAVHSIARVIFGFALLVFIYVFVSLFIEGNFRRSLAFVLVSLSGGFGWLQAFYGSDISSEMWFLTGWVEGNTFMALYALPLFSASALMLLGVFYLMIKSFESGRISYSIWAGILCFFLVSTHFFDALIVYPVLILYILVKFFLLRDWMRLLSDGKSFGIMFLVSVISPLYNFWASMVNPVFREHAWEAAITLSPGFIWFVAFFGLLAALCVIGGAAVLFDTGDKLFMRRLFLVVWAFSVPLLIYSPISFQRRLIEGVHVPIAILSAIAILFLSERLRWDPKAAGAVFLALLIPGNFYLLSKDMDYLRRNADLQSVAGFLDRDIFEALKWLEENTGRDDVVLADYEIGNYVPAISGNTVFIGHSPETLNFWAKWDLVKMFFSGEADDNFRKEFLKGWGIRYVFYSWKEKKIGPFNPYAAAYLRPVFAQKGAHIFRVEVD